MKINSRAFARELASDRDASLSRSKMNQFSRPASRGSYGDADEIYSVEPWDDDSQLEFSAFDSQGSILDDSFAPAEWAQELREPIEAETSANDNSKQKDREQSRPVHLADNNEKKKPRIGKKNSDQVHKSATARPVKSASRPS